MEIIWHDMHHRDLSAQQLYAVLALRCAVFVVEQSCPYQDVDGQDLVAENRHILGMRDDELVACARILTPADKAAPVAIGRVVVSGSARGLNLGYQLMVQTLLSCEQHWPGRSVYLSAQAHLQRFYRGLGFEACSEVYLEDAIPHIDMRK
ncbi:GNAT family N-acetyltransferase [Pantoea sp. KPR_PJ]|uniref:GNAT family N-acetyltransferase n=1 Tax=Pantoea sp. KPR_PJ TaxID=2738375 RepID=UPI0035279912